MGSGRRNCPPGDLALHLLAGPPSSAPVLPSSMGSRSDHSLTLYQWQAVQGHWLCLPDGHQKHSVLLPSALCPTSLRALNNPLPGPPFLDSWCALCFLYQNALRLWTSVWPSPRPSIPFSPPFLLSREPGSFPAWGSGEPDSVCFCCYLTLTWKGTHWSLL